MTGFHVPRPRSTDQPYEQLDANAVKTIVNPASAPLSAPPPLTPRPSGPPPPPTAQVCPRLPPSCHDELAAGSSRKERGQNAALFAAASARVPVVPLVPPDPLPAGLHLARHLFGPYTRTGPRSSTDSSCCPRRSFTPAAPRRLSAIHCKITLLVILKL
eukprot:624136-Hanusia_phi.AAC.2